MPFLPPNQQRQSTEGSKALKASLMMLMVLYMKQYSTETA